MSMRMKTRTASFAFALAVALLTSALFHGRAAAALTTPR